MPKQHEYFLTHLQNYTEKHILTDEETQLVEHIDDYIYLETIMQPKVMDIINRIKNEPGYVKGWMEYLEENEQWVTAEQKKIGLAKRREWLKRNGYGKKVTLPKDLNKNKKK